MIWLGYENTGDESEWISASKLTHAADLVSDFHIAYPANVRHSSHQGGSPQNRLGDEWTCGTTLASAYVLRHLSAVWLQLQMKGRRSEWE